MSSSTERPTREKTSSGRSTDAKGTKGTGRRKASDTATKPDASDRSPADRARDLWGRATGETWSKHLVFALIGLVAITAVIESTSDFANIELTRFGYLAIAAAGLTLLTGISGQLSLGHGAFMAVGAYTAALLLLDDRGTPLLLVLVLSIVVALIIGAVVGVAAARLSGPYIAGATLALAVAATQVPLAIRGLGGEQGLRLGALEVPGWADDLHFLLFATELGSSQYLAYLTWFSLIVILVLLANLKVSRIGRRWGAVRDDEVAAELVGINLGRDRVIAFIVSSGAAGLAGAFLALSTRLAAPGSFRLDLSLLLLTAIVLGGLGTLSGAVIGAGLLTYLPPYATDAGEALGLNTLKAAEVAPLVFGTVMVVVILLAPAGLMGEVLKRRAIRRAKKRNQAMAESSAA